MRKINLLAFAMLALMFALMFFSSWNESAIMDELPHIPAGYSYLTQKDYRLNPEHPPLLKDLAAIPLLFLNLNFPDDHFSWQKDVNGQWTFGSVFLYESGNDADKILALARLPIMLLAIFFGWLIFRWTRGRYGNKVALLTLFFYSFSPTFIAHSRYVTTDLGAAFGFFVGIIYFLKFLENQTKKNILIAGVIFGVSLLLKFSLVLLAPLYIAFGILWVFLNHYEEIKALRFYRRSLHFLKEWGKILGKILIIFAIGAAVIWPIYQYHVWNYPAERQRTDTEFTLSSFGIKPLADLAIYMSDKPVLRPFGQYALGLLMVIQRAAGGNDAYFLGKVSSSGSWYYFPAAYFFKEHLAFHFLTLLALFIAVRSVVKSRQKSFRNILEWLRSNFVLAAGMIFIAVYWLQSISSSLNIGVRHVMPTFPFIYLLVSRQTILWIKSYDIFEIPKNIIGILRIIYHHYIKSVPKKLLIFLVMLWIASATIFSFPYYLSYYNEAVGGTENGYKLVVDSNYDWGQDLKRLKFFVEENNIPKIYLNYFGGGSPAYYLKEKFIPWNSAKGAPPKGSWFAVSSTLLQNSQGKPAEGFVIKPEDSYSWLKGKTPFTRSGTSIFIYRF